jgi:glycosyltransferase involved in cell wall biosynthesis
MHVAVGIPMLLGGGTEVQTLALVRALRSDGHRITVCCYHEYAEWMVARFRAAGAEVELLKWSRGRPLWRLVADLRRVWRALRPDVVHVQYVAPGLAAVAAARLARVPRVLATIHSPASGVRAKLFVNAAAHLCDSIICVSENLERFWFSGSALLEPGLPLSTRRHWTVHNGVDVDALEAAARSTDRDGVRRSLDLDEGPVIGVVGRLRAEKGQRVLLEALPQVLRDVPEAQLLVVGDGPDREALGALALRLGIAHAVRWAGFVPPEQVSRFYAAMDVLAVPSDFEGFGLVAVEGMAVGLPVVATQAAGLREVVVDGASGWLVPPRDPGRLASALVKTLLEPGDARRMGTAGRARARTCFSRERFEARTRWLYRASSLPREGL